jgi:serine/threonine-protein kinase
VPDEKGKNPDDAGIDLQNAGLVVSRRVSEPSGTVPEGQVTRTDPAAGSTVDQGSKVVLYVSSGQPTTTTASTTTTTFLSTTSTTKQSTTTTTAP